MNNIAAPDNTALAQYLTFSLAGEEYGISILKVREILEHDTVTRVPRSPDFIRGVINLRGRVVPVVDLQVRFGQPPSTLTKRSCVVIVELELHGEKLVMGLMADAVNQVIELAPGEIEAPPSFGTPVDVAYLHGIGRTGKRFVLLLDIDAVLANADRTGDAPATTPEPASGAATGLAAAACLALSLFAAGVRAEEPSASVIKDNSFLIEEAYNQERGVVQHISTFARGQNGGWLYTFTQEWPLPDERHQLSFTLPVQQIRSEALRSTGVGDAALNYRYGAVNNDRLAFAPRLSLLMPSGRSRDSLGSGGMGLQLNLPASWSTSKKLVTHWNAGLTHTFHARGAAGEEAGLTAFTLGQSVVFLAHPRMNLLVETLWARSQAVAGPGATISSDALVISPGIRFAHDFKSGLQVVPGLAYSIGVGPSRGQHAVFVYLSLEHAFRGSAR